MTLDELKNHAEDLIRQGRREEAQARLNQIHRQPIPRSRLSEFAALARRAGRPDLALSILAPVIRPKIPLETPATEIEISTYALTLLVLGATDEAADRLQAASQSNARIQLAQGYLSINRWDYEAAVHHLRAYLSMEVVPTFETCVAQVNLAASYVALGDLRNGSPLLQELAAKTKEHEWHQLARNTKELLAQAAIQEHRFEEARALLDSATDNEKFSLTSFFIEKWKAIADSLERPAGSLDSLAKVRHLAVANQHWETVRDCDYYRAVVQKDEPLALHLYFSTPYPSYRKRLAKAVQDWMSFPKSHTLFANAPRIFDLMTAEELGATAIQLKPGKTLHRAFNTLVSDGYRPFLVGSLYSQVFGGEHFNPDSSPNRVSFLMHRLRKWLKASEIPLTLTSSEAGYRLLNSGLYGLQFRDQEQPVVSVQYEIWLKKLTSIRDSFTAAEIAETCAVSIRSARYFAAWATASGRLKKSGSGRGTRYSIE